MVRGKDWVIEGKEVCWAKVSVIEMVLDTGLWGQNSILNLGCKLKEEHTSTVDLGSGYSFATDLAGSEVEKIEL